MGLDLEMCVVPHEFENILLKWRPNLQYIEWISFTQRILSRENFQTFNDPILAEFQRDILELNNFYRYEREDFFEEQGRESSTLDYIFNRFIDESEVDLPHNILWEGGERCENCTSGQGMTLRIYERFHIENINSFFQKLSADDVLSKYDYDEMSEDGVYKLTYPGSEYILAESFSGLKSLFHRAFLNDVCILRNIY